MTDSASRVRVGFVFERVLGHVTHTDNLRDHVLDDPSVDADFVDIDWEVTGLQAAIPMFNRNWTVRSGVRARIGIRNMNARGDLDALFVHSHVPAVLATPWLRRIPTVVSVDASPLQYDALGDYYDHRAGNRYAEQLKWRATKRCFEQAQHIVAWSSWAKDGVVRDYGIHADKVTVVPPGVPLTSAEGSAHQRSADGIVRLLFVGGDFRRKGGDLLVDAFSALRDDLASASDAPKIELHLVTKADVHTQPGVFVHRDLTPNSPQLVELYERADVFCLPTRGDCLPMVLSEAGAAELPLVATAVAGVPEIVHDGETGLIVPPDDVPALTRALRTLVDDEELRVRLAKGARTLVEREFDSHLNAGRLVALLMAAARARKARR